MKIELTSKQFRRLLDLVYIGNWILNSTRGSERIPDFDELESYMFSKCADFDMDSLYEVSESGEHMPSQAFREGGIHEAIMDYEDTVFFEILAEELAHRDMFNQGIPFGDPEELSQRIKAYIAEFEENGINNLLMDADL